MEAPTAGESFTGWLTRYAARCHVPVGVLVDALGLPVRTSAVDARPVWADILISDATAGAVAATTGLSRAQLAGTCLSSYDGTLLDLADIDPDDETSIRTVAGDQWLLTGHSRACPDCLAADGTWLTWWRLGFAGVCPKHRVVLADSCPGCGHRLASGVRYPRTSMPGEPWQCGHALRGRRCTHDLRTVDRVAAPANAVEAQAALMAAAATGTAVLAGTPVPVQDYVATWRAVMNVMRGSTTPPFVMWSDPLRAAWADEKARLDTGNGSGRRRPTPGAAALTAGLLDAAWPLMSAENIAEAQAAASALATHAATGSRRGQQRHWRAAEHTRVIGGLLAAARPRQARIAGVLNAVVGTDCDSKHIPTTIDPATYGQCFAGLLPGTAEQSGRLYAAMVCARICGQPSWAKAAAVLDIPPDRGARLADVLTRRVTDVGALTAAARATVDDLDSARVDYRARRQELAELERIDHDVLRTVMRGRPITMSRTIHAAAWLWEHHTASPAAWSPAHRAALASGARRDSLREAYRIFVRTLTPDQQALLVKFGPRPGGAS